MMRCSVCNGRGYFKIDKDEVLKHPTPSLHTHCPVASSSVHTVHRTRMHSALVESLLCGRRPTKKTTNSALQWSPLCSQVSKRDDCPPKVLESVDDFYVCKTCGKLYWEGPKSNNAFGHFESIFEQFGHDTPAAAGGADEPPSPAIARMQSGGGSSVAWVGGLGIEF